MKIDLTELMNRRVDCIELDYTFDPDHTDVPCIALPEDITVPENGVRVTGSCTDSLGCLTMRLHVTARYRTLCARCLDEIEKTLAFDLERILLTDQPTGSPSHLSDSGEWDGDTEDVIVLNESRLIPDADVLEELALALPPLDLCSPDCPGLCPFCGKPLKNGDCGCREEKKLNPKLAILQKLLDNPE